MDQDVEGEGLEIDRAVRDVSAPGSELLGKVLRHGPRPRPPTATVRPRQSPGRVELLCPADPAEAYAPGTAVVPLVLAVEADRYPSEDPAARPVERLIIAARYPIVVGRGPDMDVPVWDRSVSRRHAEIDWRGDAWAVRDLESTNGTRINGTVLGPSEVRTLAAGDQIDLGFFARLTVRSVLTVLHPAGAAADIHRLLDWLGRSAVP